MRRRPGGLAGPSVALAATLFVGCAAEYPASAPEDPGGGPGAGASDDGESGAHDRLGDAGAPGETGGGDPDDPGDPGAGGPGQDDPSAGGAPGSGGEGGAAAGSGGEGGAAAGSGGEGGAAAGSGGSAGLGEPAACVGAGESCDRDLPCCAGSHCSFIDYGTIVCAPSAPDGGACYENAGCLSGRCAGGLCRATSCSAVGATCAQFSDEGCCDGFCTSNGSSYIEGICAAPQPSGSYCEESHWCESYACVDWVCL